MHALRKARSEMDDFMEVDDGPEIEELDKGTQEMPYVFTGAQPHREPRVGEFYRSPSENVLFTFGSPQRSKPKQRTTEMDELAVPPAKRRRIHVVGPRSPDQSELEMLIDAKMWDKATDLCTNPKRSCRKSSFNALFAAMYSTGAYEELLDTLADHADQFDFMMFASSLPVLSFPSDMGGAMTVDDLVADSHRLRGNRAYIAGDIDTALECYGTGLASSGLQNALIRARLHHNRAACYEKSESHVDIIYECDLAVEHMRQYEKVYRKRSHANEETGRFDLAINDLRIVIELCAASSKDSAADQRKLADLLRTEYHLDQCPWVVYGFSAHKMPALGAVKKAHRQLLLQYHPDKWPTGDPRQVIVTDITVRLGKYWEKCKEQIH
eukprot:Clim_evm94s207 gene=Clim_evmTU94s207